MKSAVLVFFVFFSAVSLTFAPPCFAESADAPTAESSAAAQAPGSGTEAPPFFDRHSWQVGLETYSMDYEEPGFMEQSGLMLGVVGSYAYHNGWMFKGELGFGGGELDYTSNGTGSLSGVDTGVLETQVVGGYDFILSETAAITLFGGFGYRFLSNDSAGRRTSTGAFGYLRESNYFYSPIGIEGVSKVSEKWRLSAVFEYDHFWSGEQKSYLSDVDFRFNNPTNDQDDGYGLRASFSAARDLGWGTLVFTPFIRYWDIGDSDIAPFFFRGALAGYVIEPANTTTEAGLRVSLRF